MRNACVHGREEEQEMEKEVEQEVEKKVEKEVEQEGREGGGAGGGGGSGGGAGSPYQEDDGRGADEGDGSGQLPLVPPAVAPRLPLRVLAQPQLPHPPPGHLGGPSGPLKDRTTDSGQAQGSPHIQ